MMIQLIIFQHYNDAKEIHILGVCVSCNSTILAHDTLPFRWDNWEGREGPYVNETTVEPR